MVKFTVRLDSQNDKPELAFDFNTASTDLQEAEFKRFIALAGNVANTLELTSTTNANGTTSVKINVVPVTP